MKRSSKLSGWTVRSNGRVEVRAEYPRNQPMCIVGYDESGVPATTPGPILPEEDTVFVQAHFRPHTSELQRLSSDRVTVRALVQRSTLVEPGTDSDRALRRPTPAPAIWSRVRSGVGSKPVMPTWSLPQWPPPKLWPELVESHLDGVNQSAPMPSKQGWQLGGRLRSGESQLQHLGEHEVLELRVVRELLEQLRVVGHGFGHNPADRLIKLNSNVLFV
jgi:hypothetical protein